MENSSSQADSDAGSGPSSSRQALAVASSSRRQIFLDLVRQSNLACQNGDFPAAVTLYSEALKIDPSNHILYSNRSAALIKMGQFSKALQDAVKAKELYPKWSKAYYRQGVALQCLGKHGEALAAFSQGLAQDPKSSQLLNGLIEAATKSPLKAKLDPIFEQLASMKLASSPFVVISVIGQELLASGHYNSAVQALESALRIGTSNLKLKGSVFSAISSAYWALNQLDKAISYMEEDLGVAKSLGDLGGECRAQGNLGSAYFSQANYKDALTSHRYQLVLAMKCKDTSAAASALTSLGHVYTSIGDYSNALASHKQCVQILKQMGGDPVLEGKEIGNVGAVYLLLGDFDNAIDCHTEHLRIAKQQGNRVEEARAYSNLGSCYHYRRNFDQAITFHNQVLKISQDLGGDKGIEARAYAGLGHAARCMGDLTAAKMWHGKQLDVALLTKDRVNEGRACSNLGIVFQLLGDHDAALKLHQAHLQIANLMKDKAGMGRGYGNIGNCYNALGFFDQAIKCHKQELSISKEVNDRSSEASTHGNLAVSYQALGILEKALVHYHSHLGISRELKDSNGEACALLNLGNCHSQMGDFEKGIPFYENYLMLSQELNDVEAEGRACHFLGFAHYQMGHYKEAVRYYNQDLCLAKELQNSANIARAYCNLGLTYQNIGNLEEALECQKCFLALSHSMKDFQGKYRALGNIGNIMLKMRKTDEAVKVFHKQVLLAKASGDKGLEAGAYSALGTAHRVLKRFDLALGFHTQELTILQETNDSRGETRAHGNLGAVHMSLGNYTSAIKCYEEMLERAKELKDPWTEAQAYGNLGIARINLGNYEEAGAFFELQLSILESLSSSQKHSQSSSLTMERGRAYGNLGDCYSSIGDHQEAISCHEKSLQISIKMNNFREQEKTYRALGQGFKALGNGASALSNFEKRLGVLNRLIDRNDSGSGSVSGSDASVSDELIRLKSSALADLGGEFLNLRNFDQALNCFQQKLEISKDLEDKGMEAEGASLLGTAFQIMGKTEEALKYFELDLRISQDISSVKGKGRAYGNIGVIYETLGNFEDALLYQEHCLNAANKLDDGVSKGVAYGAIGRIHHALGNNIQAVAYLQQGLQLIEKLNQTEEEAKIRHFLGLAFWRHGDLDSAQAQLEKASDLLEAIRQEMYGSGSEYSLALFDRQIASYQALQRILVQMGRTDLTLLFAEKSRTLANSTLRRKGEGQGQGGFNSSDLLTNAALNNSLINSVDSLLQRVNRHRVAVLYFSTAAGYLYSWLLIPDRGVVKFNESCISGDDEEDSNSGNNMGTLLERYIEGTRDALGLDFNNTLSGSSRSLCPGDSEGEGGTSTDLWSQHLEELGDKLNGDSDKTGFLRMVSRNHRFNCSSYSLSSLFSVGSGTGSVKSSSTSRPGSTRTRRGNGNNQQSAGPQWQGPSCLRSLYQILIAPFEEELGILDQTCFKELVLILESDLILVPFPLLRSCTNEEYLCEKFKLIIAPSISSIRSGGRCKAGSDFITNPLIIGNPCIPSEITEKWGWEPIPRSQNEAEIISELLVDRSNNGNVRVEALTGLKARKETVLSLIGKSECIHFATHISWKLSAIVLSPQQQETIGNDSSKDISVSSTSSSEDNIPPFSDYLLTAADILKLRLNAKLIVLSCCHTKDNKSDLPTNESLMSLTKALLAAGAMSVLVTLWPVPETASKIFFRAFYSSLLQGSKVSHALSEAMLTVRHTKHFAHPANWAGYLLLGSDVQLSNRVNITGKALWELMKAPERSRDALRVSLHLVEKSLQRIGNGQKNAMYTTQKSIENKVGTVTGWKEILMSVGFRFEPASNGLPAAVFFPQTDHGERLVKCSANLQALLGLSPQAQNALSKLLSTPEAGEEVITILRQAIAELASNNLEAEKVEVKVNVKLWGIVGCHELLASLGFDLIEVGENEVIVGVGKHVTMRMLQFALQASLSLFESRDSANPHFGRSLSLESLDLGTEELCDFPRSNCPALLLPPQKIPMGKGAFTSYVRSRGEPDGQQLPYPDTHILKGNGNGTEPPPLPAMRNLANRMYQNIRIQRADSSSSGSSSITTTTTTEWDNSISTVIRRRAPPVPDTLPTIPPQTARKPGGGRYIQNTSRTSITSQAGKRVTWKMNEMAMASSSASQKGQGPSLSSLSSSSSSSPSSKEQQKPWIGIIPPPTSNNAGGNRTSLQDVKDQNQRGLQEGHNNNSLGRDVPLTLTEVYQDRNLPLGLAPSLSKLLLSNRVSLSSIENPRSTYYGGEEGATTSNNLDETLSSFDQISLPDDSLKIEKSPPKSKVSQSVSGTPSRGLKGRSSSGSNPNQKNGSGPFVTTAEISPISLNVSEIANTNNPPSSSSSVASSKSSPTSDFKERDEGDGRSLTDSQYGSYSPSMAQNDLIVQTAVHFANNGNSNNRGSCEGPVLLHGKNSSLIMNEDINIMEPSSLSSIVTNNIDGYDNESDKTRRIIKNSPIRNSKLSIHLSTPSNQKSSQC